jgi:hypothetical protein
MGSGLKAQQPLVTFHTIGNLLSQPVSMITTTDGGSLSALFTMK